MNTYLQILWIRKYMLLTTYVPYIFILGPWGKYYLGHFWEICLIMFPETVLVSPVILQKGAE